MVSQSQRLYNHNTVILFQASKGKTILAAKRDQVHTHKITRHRS